MNRYIPSFGAESCPRTPHTRKEYKVLMKYKEIDVTGKASRDCKRY
jgi:hypothetical protein